MRNAHTRGREPGVAGETTGKPGECTWPRGGGWFRGGGDQQDQMLQRAGGMGAEKEPRGSGDRRSLEPTEGAVTVRLLRDPDGVWWGGRAWGRLANSLFEGPWQPWGEERKDQGRVVGGKAGGRLGFWKG